MYDARLQRGWTKKKMCAIDQMLTHQKQSFSAVYLTLMPRIKCPN